MNFYFVGNPTTHKGIEDFNLIAKKIPKANFYWFCFKLNNEIKKSYPKINFLAGLKDLEMKNKIEKEMDVFICCSHFEGFCLPIAEAIWLGKPVISYSLRELIDVYKDNIEYVAPFETKRFIKKIQGIIINGKNVKKIIKAKKFVIRNYSPEVVAQRLLNIIF